LEFRERYENLGGHPLARFNLDAVKAVSYRIK
jgi:hypothetical protein